MGEKNWMKKVIFFSDLNKLHEALKYFDITSFSGKKIPIKLHMGEIKNKYFPRYQDVKLVVDELIKVGADPFFTDTTVAYSGLRNSKSGYLKVAKLHGFNKKKTGCDAIIDDTGIIISVKGRDYEVADQINNASHIFAFTHVKGHIATGMGGSIKNFGMGGVTKETKRRMHHGSRPIYLKDACTYCGLCDEACPFNAISVGENTWEQDMRKCFGCGVCVNACKSNAMKYKDADFQYVLACAAKACVQDKNVIYINEVKRIARSCDCDPFAGPAICPDIGYLVSDDPVAIDKASLDLIHDVKPDVFEKVNKINPFKQIKYGEEIGLGSSSYELIKL